jgi:selenocysteine lyase/cysteine desulfurase
VAVGATVSGFVGLIAASLPTGTRIFTPDVEFTSTLFPLLVAEQHSGASVQTVPAARLADAIDADVDVVAFSAVQMSSGEVADLDAIAEAADAHDVITLVDATQACGWLPLDASRFDVVVCAAYKWLMSPRGTAFMSLRRERLAETIPWAANWYAGEEVHSSYFGPPLRLAHDARRLDTSPAWFSWVGTQPALELINEIGVDTIHIQDLGLANRFRAGLGLAPGSSAIVSVDLPGAAERLTAAGIVAAVRDGRLRVSWHLYNTEADVDRTLDVLAG